LHRKLLCSLAFQVELLLGALGAELLGDGFSLGPGLGSLFGELRAFQLEILPQLDELPPLGGDLLALGRVFLLVEGDGPQRALQIGLRRVQFAAAGIEFLLLLEKGAAVLLLGALPRVVPGSLLGDKSLLQRGEFERAVAKLSRFLVECGPLATRLGLLAGQLGEQAVNAGGKVAFDFLEPPLLGENRRVHRAADAGPGVAGYVVRRRRDDFLAFFHGVHGEASKKEYSFQAARRRGRAAAGGRPRATRLHRWCRS
jgi:hypothetical protein